MFIDRKPNKLRAPEEPHVIAPHGSSGAPNLNRFRGYKHLAALRPGSSAPNQRTVEFHATR